MRHIKAYGPILFIAWTAIGACASVAILTPFTIGLPSGLVAAVGAYVLLINPRGCTPSAFGALCGAGVVPLYVAWLNRDGPGTICTTNATTTSSYCVQEWNPWFWFSVGFLLIASGVAGFIFLSKRRRH